MADDNTANNRSPDPTNPAGPDNDTAAVSNSSLYDFVRHDLPKVEVHAHLNGCIPSDLLHTLAAERGVTLPAKYFGTTPTTTDCVSDNDAAAAAALPNASSLSQHPPSMYAVQPRSLQDCFDLFAQLPAVVNDLEAVRAITEAVVHDVACQHAVVYLELRSTPKRLPLVSSRFPSAPTTHTRMGTKDDYVDTVVTVLRNFQRRDAERYKREMEEWRRDDHDNENNKDTQKGYTSTRRRLPRLPMTCRFIVSVDRSQSLEEATENVELAIRRRKQQLTEDNNDTASSSEPSSSSSSMIVGIDLGGNPTKNDWTMFAPLFQRARDHGLKVTVHCAEIPCSNPNDIRSPAAYAEAEAMLDFHPDRLGHAVLLPTVLLHKLDALQIPVETCPTSNVMTLELHTATNHSLVQGLQQHHVNLKHWLLETKHPILVCVDDSGVFSTTPSLELWLLVEAFKLTQTDLERIVVGSIDHLFCDNDTKEEIRSLVKERIDTLRARR